jgi:hypothetical protein
VRQAKKEPIILGMFGEQVGEAQSKFERTCTGQLNIKAGMFAIHYEQNRYVNRNIQWLWKQFLKGRA